MCASSFDTSLSDFLDSIAEQEVNAGNSAAAELYKHRAQQARQLQEQAAQYDPQLLPELAAAKARVLELERRLADVQLAINPVPRPAITPSAR